MSTPILVQLDQNAQFRLETDALGYTSRTVLSQLCNDGKWHPEGFTLKGLDTAERNYEIHDKEPLSVICGLFIYFYFYFLLPPLLSVREDPYFRHYIQYLLASSDLSVMIHSQH